MPIILENIYYHADAQPEGEKLRDVSLEIKDGDFIGVIGARGDGAGILTAIIGRAHTPLCGNVKIIDCDAVCVPKRPERFLSESTVEKQLSLVLAHNGIYTAEMRERISAALELVGLDPEKYCTLSPLSLTQGEKRLVSVAEALVHDSECLLLDDPAEDMDGEWSRRFMESLKRLNENGKTVVVASGDIDILSEYVRRVIVLRDGRIVCDGTAKSVFTDYYELIRNGVCVPRTVRCARILRERGTDMPDNVLTYRQFIDRLKILMWRKVL